MKMRKPNDQYHLDSLATLVGETSKMIRTDYGGKSPQDSLRKKFPHLSENDLQEIEKLIHQKIAGCRKRIKPRQEAIKARLAKAAAALDELQEQAQHSRPGSSVRVAYTNLRNAIIGVLQ